MHWGVESATTYPMVRPYLSAPIVSTRTSLPYTRSSANSFAARPKSCSFSSRILTFPLQAWLPPPPMYRSCGESEGSICPRLRWTPYDKLIRPL